MPPFQKGGIVSFGRMLYTVKNCAADRNVCRAFFKVLNDLKVFKVSNAVGGGLLQSLLNHFGLLLVARFFEQGEHVLLVRLDTRLVERIDA